MTASWSQLYSLLKTAQSVNLGAVMEIHDYERYNNEGGVMNENRNLHCVRRRCAVHIDNRSQEKAGICEENVRVCRLLLQ